MHTIYTFTLRVFIIAAILCIVALKFCSGKTIQIKTTYERPHILIARNATVAQTKVGIDDCNCMTMLKTHNVLHMFTTGGFAHAQIYNMCISCPNKALKHTFEKCASEPLIVSAQVCL